MMLIKYNDSYSKISRNLYQFYSDNPKGTGTDSASFKFKQKFLSNAINANIMNEKFALPLKHIISNFLRNLQILLSGFILTWSVNCVTPEVSRVTAFAIADKKLSVPVVTLPTNDNAIPLEKLKSSFKRTIYWYKYQSKETT